MTKAEKIASFCEKYNVNEADFEKKVANENEPTQLDRIEAQTMWTALMTDTLLED